MWNHGVRTIALGLACAGALTLAGTRAARGQAPAAQSGAVAEKRVWYFYKVKWGHQDEFVELIPYQETRQYVKRVLRSYREYVRLGGLS